MRGLKPVAPRGQRSERRQPTAERAVPPAAGARTAQRAGLQPAGPATKAQLGPGGQ